MYSMKKSIRNSNFEFQTVQIGLTLDVEVIFYPAEPENRILEAYCEVQSVKHKGVELEIDDILMKASPISRYSLDSILQEEAFDAARKEYEDDFDG